MTNQRADIYYTRASEIFNAINHRPMNDIVRRGKLYIHEWANDIYVYTKPWLLGKRNVFYKGNYYKGTLLYRPGDWEQELLAWHKEAVYRDEPEVEEEEPEVEEEEVVEDTRTINPNWRREAQPYIDKLVSPQTIVDAITIMKVTGEKMSLGGVFQVYMEPRIGADGGNRYSVTFGSEHLFLAEDIPSEDRLAVYNFIHGDWVDMILHRTVNPPPELPPEGVYEHLMVRHNKSLSEVLLSDGRRAAVISNGYFFNVLPGIWEPAIERALAIE